MLAEQPQIISLTQLAAVAGCSRDHITQLYLHWTAGRYGQIYDDYHINIDADGTVYRTSSSLSQYKSHTWRRNSGSIAVALCCGLGAQANHGYDADRFRHALAARSITACIPSKSNRKKRIEHDRVLYRQRHKIANMLGRLKDWRRVLTLRTMRTHLHVRNLHRSRCHLLALINES